MNDAADPNVTAPLGDRYSRRTEMSCLPLCAQRKTSAALALLLFVGSMPGPLSAAGDSAGRGGGTGHVRVLSPNLKAPSATLPPLIDRAAGIKLHSCPELLALIRSNIGLGEAAESPRFNAYADCLATAVVADSQGASGSPFDLSQAGRRIYRDLDLSTLRSSLASRQSAVHNRLRDFKAQAVDIQPLSITLKIDGFRYAFEVLALGDFRGLGQAELLVRFSDRAENGGSYDRTSMLVLGWAAGSSALVATDVVEVLGTRATRQGPAR